ncbi:facilitated trehalose transporter Tret1-like [Pieris napi]|uniref:facilitated trehalose transporter Tret1-like n=1 Tax=Pieris napi TaxID=78633 RepID=UPI001FBA331C|nr:facilitated trehalose transporter Tret1-like [Pieris napi]
MSLHPCTYPDPGFFTKTSLIQFGYGVWVNLSVVMIGLAFSFPAVAIPQLKSPESNIMISISEESWIASVLTLVSPIGCVTCGYFMDRLGRRPLLIFSPLPLSIGWFYTGFAKQAKDIIIGRIITGIGVGMAMSVPRVYLTEISLPNMRGVIGSFPNVAMSIGITVQAGLGAVFHWETLCHIAGSYGLFLCFLNFFLPETPYFLLEKATMDDAEKSLRRFRSNKHNIEWEMEELMDFKIDNNIKKLTLGEQFAALFRKSSCKPFWIVMIYILITQLSGVTILIMWAVELLQNSKSSVDPHAGNVMLGLTRLFSGIAASALIFRTGRRPLALVSGLGVGIVCLALGLTIQYKEYPTVFPQIGYILYIIFGSLGHYTLPVLIMFELYPLQVRGILGGISMSILNFMIFGANKTYPYVRDALGYPYTIMTFGVCSLLGCIYLYFYLPETKGLTLQEIEEYYNDLRPTLTSQRLIRSEMYIRGVGLGSPSRSLIRLDRFKDKSLHMKRGSISKKGSNEDETKDNADKDK